MSKIMSQYDRMVMLYTERTKEMYLFFALYLRIKNSLFSTNGIGGKKSRKEKRFHVSIRGFWKTTVDLPLFTKSVFHCPLWYQNTYTGQTDNQGDRERLRQRYKQEERNHFGSSTTADQKNILLGTSALLNSVLGFANWRRSRVASTREHSVPTTQYKFGVDTPHTFTKPSRETSPPSPPTANSSEVKNFPDNKCFLLQGCISGSRFWNTGAAEVSPAI